MRHSETLTPARLTATREVMGLSRDAMADRIGVDYQTIRRWETPGVRIPMVAEVALRTVQKERAEELVRLAEWVKGGGDRDGRASA